MLERQLPIGIGGEKLKEGRETLPFVVVLAKFLGVFSGIAERGYVERDIRMAGKLLKRWLG